MKWASTTSLTQPHTQYTGGAATEEAKMSGQSGRLIRYRNTFKHRAAPKAEQSDDDEESDREEEESVYFALCEDDRVGIERMLKEGLDPNYTFNGDNQLGKTALHLCCEKGLIECAKLFMAVNAKLNAIDGWHQTPLMYAVCTERLEMVKMMMEAGANPDKRDRHERAVLHFTVQHETTACMRALLDMGADVDVPDSIGRTPLWVAAAEDGREEAMRCLLEYDADVCCKDFREKRIPLQAALAHTHTDTLLYIHILLDAGSPVNVVDEYGHTPVMTILKNCYNKNRDLSDADKHKVQLLLDAGLDLDLVCDKVSPGVWYQYHDTALNLAIMHHLPIAIEFLLEVGADPDKHGGLSHKGRRAVPPLITAARESRLQLTSLLLQHNCNMAAMAPDPADPTRTLSAFHCALELEHWEFLELLLQAGYDLRPETYLWTNVDVPEQLVLNLDLWSRLVEQIANPVPLLVLSRQRVRRALGVRLQQKVKKLPLPTYLKDMLLLKDL